MISSPRTTRLLMTVLYLSFVVVVVTLAWAADRGFDITDESYYLIGYHLGVSPAFGLTYFHALFNALFGWLNLSVLGTRLTGFFVGIISSGLLAYALAGYLRSKGIALDKLLSFYLLFPALTVGTLMSFGWLPQTPSYNTFSVWLSQLVLTVYLYRTQSKRSLPQLFSSAALGFLLGLIFLNKFPNLFTVGLSLALFSVMFEPAKQHVGVRDLLLQIAAGVLGFVLALIFVFGSGSFEHTIGFVSQILQSGQLRQSSGYLDTYVTDFLTLLDRLAYYLSVVGLLFGLAYWKRNQFTEKVLKIGSVATIALLVIIEGNYIGGGGNKHLLIDPYVLGVIVCLGRILLSDIPASKKKLLVGIYLLTLSFLAGAIGSGNPLSIQSTIYVSFMMGMMVISALTLNSRTLYLLVILTSVVCASQTLTGRLLYPYREWHSIQDQQFDIDQLEGFADIRVDSAKQDIVFQLDQIRKLEIPYMYTLSPQLGFILLADKKPFAFGWCEEDPVVCEKLILNENDRRAEDIIFALPSKIELNSEIKQALQFRGINFPDDYKVFKQIGYTDCQFGGYREVTFFVHKTQ